MLAGTRCQQRLDCTPVNRVELNAQCRHEIVPFLQALQHIYGNRKLREKLLEPVANDVPGATFCDMSSSMGIPDYNCEGLLRRCLLRRSMLRKPLLHRPGVLR